MQKDLFQRQLIQTLTWKLETERNLKETDERTSNGFKKDIFF